MFMKRITIYALMLLGVLMLFMSCGRHRPGAHGFVDAPQGSTFRILGTRIRSVYSRDIHGVGRIEL